ncbi:MAG: hypothetical protein IMZ50_10115 [Candidatus Atribacteria bacterium]|nr:hypothetical protein [Candidatus Atribacteria bacterium]
MARWTKAEFVITTTKKRRVTVKGSVCGGWGAYRPAAQVASSRVDDDAQWFLVHLLTGAASACYSWRHLLRVYAAYMASSINWLRKDYKYYCRADIKAKGIAAYKQAKETR